MVYSVAIAVNDEISLRKKQGDIIAVRPQGWEWGTKEVKNHLILEIDIPLMSSIEDGRRLMVPHYADGSLGAVESGDFSESVKPDVLAKRRFSIPLADILLKAGTYGAVLDVAKIQDVEDAYQPVSRLKMDFVGLIQDGYLSKKITEIEINNIKKG